MIYVITYLIREVVFDKLNTILSYNISYSNIIAIKSLLIYSYGLIRFKIYNKQIISIIIYTV